MKLEEVKSPKIWFRCVDDTGAPDGRLVDGGGNISVRVADLQNPGAFVPLFVIPGRVWAQSFDQAARSDLLQALELWLARREQREAVERDGAPLRSGPPGVDPPAAVSLSRHKGE